MQAVADRPKVSIITVCFNAATGLPRTIASIRDQTLQDREWVVVDGGSHDNTVALVKTASTVPAAFVSEPDRGIYDAMNKAVAMSRGELLFFLNADDRFFDRDVLADVVRAFDAQPGMNFLLGGVVVEAHRQLYLHAHRHVNRWTLPFVDPCHQGVVVRRRLFDEIGPFDLRWPTSADYDWFLRASRAGHRLHHLDRVLAFYPAAGAHAADPQALAKERKELRLRYLSPAALAAGTFLTRVAHRVSKTLRGGLAWDQHHWQGVA
jgi:glycosyltransferase involved in cell wall biosynthesis